MDRRLCVLLPLATVAAATRFAPSAAQLPPQSFEGASSSGGLSAFSSDGVRPPPPPRTTLGEPCPRGQECVSISDCAAYQTRREIRQRRPVQCGFFGLRPRVCCDRLRTVSEATQSPLPKKCGGQKVNVKPLQFHSRRRRKASPTRSRRPGFLTGSASSSSFTTYRPRLVRGGSDVPLHVPFNRFGGGGYTAVHRWPWMVLFGRWTNGRLGDWFCGGTLITDQHVLTAAHCLRPEQATAVGARIADHDLTTSDEVSHEERSVSRITRHPQYVGAQNDLAVVRLSSPVESSFSVEPICLPPAGADHYDRDVEVAGWGMLEYNGDAPDVLQEAPLRVTDVRACEASYRRLPKFTKRFPGGFQGTKVCAGSRDSEPRDACKGDSGGPLMALINPNSSRAFGAGSYELVGVVSGGFGCGSLEFPGVYTKVSAYIGWILSQLN